MPIIGPVGQSQTAQTILGMQRNELERERLSDDRKNASKGRVLQSIGLANDVGGILASISNKIMDRASAESQLARQLAHQTSEREAGEKFEREDIQPFEKEKQKKDLQSKASIAALASATQFGTTGMDILSRLGEGFLSRSFEGSERKKDRDLEELLTGERIASAEGIASLREDRTSERHIEDIELRRQLSADDLKRAEMRFEIEDARADNRAASDEERNMILRAQNFLEQGKQFSDQGGLSPTESQQLSKVSLEGDREGAQEILRRAALRQEVLQGALSVAGDDFRFSVGEQSGIFPASISEFNRLNDAQQAVVAALAAQFLRRGGDPTREREGLDALLGQTEFGTPAFASEGERDSIFPNPGRFSMFNPFNEGNVSKRFRGTRALDQVIEELRLRRDDHPGVELPREGLEGEALRRALLEITKGFR